MTIETTQKTGVSPYKIAEIGTLEDNTKPRNRTSFRVTQQRLLEARKILNDLKINC